MKPSSSELDYEDLHGAYFYISVTTTVSTASRLSFIQRTRPDAERLGLLDEAELAFRRVVEQERLILEREQKMKRLSAQPEQ